MVDPHLYTGVVRRFACCVLVCTIALTALLEAQRRRPQARAATPRTEAVEMACPNVLGTGVRSGRVFCDVLVKRDPLEGIVIKLPARQGPATLTFDLHNRHIYSADLERAGRAFARNTATVGVLTMDNTLLARAIVRTEFRTEADLLDRVPLEGNPDVLKAVAPIGAEPVRVEIPADVEAVSILGEKMSSMRLDGELLFTAPASPIAVISQPMIEYRPAATPARRR